MTRAPRVTHKTQRIAHLVLPFHVMFRPEPVYFARGFSAILEDKQNCKILIWIEALIPSVREDS